VKNGCCPNGSGGQKAKLDAALARISGENAVGQQLDVFGEQAKDELGDEMGDATFVILPAQRHGDIG
jgi:hypothetical protein